MPIIRTPQGIKVIAEVPKKSFPKQVDWYKLPDVNGLSSYLTLTLEAVTGSGRKAIRVVNNGILPFDGKNWKLYYTGYQGVRPDAPTWKTLPVVLVRYAFIILISYPDPSAHYVFFLSYTNESGIVQTLLENSINTPADGTITALEQAQLDILSVVQAAANAQSTADGAIRSFYQTTAPTAGVSSEGDIWFDTDDGNKIYTYRSLVWVATPDSGIALALTNASNAQGTADGKAKIWYQTAQPTGLTILDSGELWVNTDDKLKVGALK